MSNFLQTAMEELTHVVWPTREESKKYMLYTVGVIISMTMILMIVGYALQMSMSGIRSQFPHYQNTMTSSGEENVTRKELEDIQKALGKDTTSSGSGSSSSSGSVQSGSGK